MDVEEFAPGPGPVGRRLLFVGILSHSHSHKGLHYLLEALAEAPCRRVCLDVVGDGDARLAYEEQCRRLGISDRVHFLGRLYGPTLVKRYKNAYALVQPSTNDSFPTTIVEAMACGRPVIASRIGGLSSIVRHGINGNLVKPGDPRALALAIEDLFSDPARATEYGRAARRLVESAFTTEEQADRTEEVFEEVMKSFNGKVSVVTPSALGK